jgi:hypothetical protein
VATNHGCIINHHTDDNQPQSSASALNPQPFPVPFQLSAFQRFSVSAFRWSRPQPSTINAQLLCSGNRLLLQRAATATLWDREAGTRVSKVRTDTGTKASTLSSKLNVRCPPPKPSVCPRPPSHFPFERASISAFQRLQGRLRVISRPCGRARIPPAAEKSRWPGSHRN